jgi:hypothetical protein
VAQHATRPIHRRPSAWPSTRWSAIPR